MTRFIETSTGFTDVEVLFDQPKSFEQLAERVAESFKRLMEEEGFETFREMKRSYMWEADDIRFEICYYVLECGGECYDDLTFVEIDSNHEMPYGKFKKMVMANLK